ncbi:F-box only protein 31 [Strongylocentrotus purpuratus]|uniref:F-box domain-containing protein n=1 Tax=Strongylocentrotus purpuratus TaxID=7668 RepID=A0A7M7N6J2_STRPU|nr:F-box only protein 31 [Strongylocentrotus purpuratus]XP_030831745.1 F-box only protein 31 [Strongylocentrotus purpuratus]
MNIDELPLEVITSIFCRLPGKDLAIVAQTCKEFHEASLVEAVWLLKCKEEFGVDAELQEPEVESYRQLYTKVLYPYGHLLGVWQAQRGPYGGLVKIQMTEGMIKAVQYYTPVDPRVYLPIRVKDLFQVRLDPQDGLAHLECLKGKGGPHKLGISRKSSESDPEFTLNCYEPKKHGASMFHDLIMEELDDLTIDEFHVDHLKMKYMKLEEFDSICTFKSLEPPKTVDNMPVKPGIFKGTYGGHGIELIYVTYVGNRMMGMKITGDPNVPATKVSLEVHLDKPMVLDLVQQESVHALEDLDLQIVRPSSEQPQESQPFRLSSEVHDRGMSLLGEETGLDLRRCKQRFYGTGLIAMSGFRDAERTPAHCIIFNEDVMAFLWLKLKSVSIYSRVKEDIWS